MRRPKGQLYRTKTKGGVSYGVRFGWKGERYFRTVGHSTEGMTKKKALQEIEVLMAGLVAGSWEPERRRARRDREDEEAASGSEQFETFAMRWLDDQKQIGGPGGKGLSDSAAKDLEWRLRHLLAWFGGSTLEGITTEEVDRFVKAKLTVPNDKGKVLSPTSVRKFVALLSVILRRAVRYDRVPRNVAEDIDIPGSDFKGSALTTAGQVVALLDAAGEQDAAVKRGRAQARVLLATLALAGLRIDEALSLKWRDLDLAQGVIRVRRAKTQAGIREVDVLPLLRDELLAHAARYRTSADDLVFATGTGGKQSPSNVRTRLLGPAVKRAGEILAKRDLEPLAERITPHSLRRTYASLLTATGADVGHIADQIGHEDPGFTIKTYRRTMKRKDGELERLAALVLGTRTTIADLYPEAEELGGRLRSSVVGRASDDTYARSSGGPSSWSNRRSMTNDSKGTP